MSNFREKTALWNELTDEQSEKLVGGVGAGTTGGNSKGFNGWGAADTPSEGHGLFGADQGFGPTVVEHGANGTSVVHPR